MKNKKRGATKRPIFVRIREYFLRLSLRWRRYTRSKGYACDVCGKELFDYPLHRLCEACESVLTIPERPCLKCGRNCVSEGVCLDCKADLPRFTKGISPFVYKGNVAMLLNRLKNGHQRLAAYFGERMGEKFVGAVPPELLQESILLVAVPMTKERRIERGYNQAERLAECVCGYLTERGIVAETDFEVIEKVRETKLQKRMSRRERKENVKGAFFVRKRKVCRDRIIILVDDVFTTGATGNECADRLFGAGAREVYFLTATALPELKK